MTFRRILGATALAFILTGCSSRPTKSSEPTYKLGDSVKVGNLTYVATEVQWLDQLGDSPTAKPPKNRYLAVRLSVTNSGVRQTMIPSAELLDGSGKAYPEVTEASELRDWLGAFRAVQPAQTEHGLIVFDVPGGAYRMRIVDDSDAEEQKSAIILLPYQVPAMVPRPERPIPGA